MYISQHLDDLLYHGSLSVISTLVIQCLFCCIILYCYFLTHPKSFFKVFCHCKCIYVLFTFFVLHLENMRTLKYFFNVKCMFSQ